MLFAHHGPLSSPDTLSYIDPTNASSTFTSVGSYSAPSGSRMRSLLSNKNLYFTTSAGVYKTDGYSETPILSGAYKALDLDAYQSGASGFLSAQGSVAYRGVWAYEDLNSNLILGAPSQRCEFTNPSAVATCDVDLTVTIPSGVTTEWLFQLYRSSEVDGGAGETPDDNLQLVLEVSPTSGELSDGYFSVTDITPDDQRGAYLYTAQSQSSLGILAANERPPLCEDMALYENCAFYANTISKHRLNFTLLFVGGSSGLAVNDTVTIAGQVYTAKSSETISSRYFKLYSSGSDSQNIRDTALSLIKCINRNSSSTVYAYYLSGPTDKPGLMLLEERSIGGSSFTATSSRTTCWSPVNLPATSSNEVKPNGLAWSKPNQPEAVPLTNFVQVGARDYEILRIIALKDALLIFKEEGIYKLTGKYPNFSVDVLDISAKLIAKNSPAILNNRVFCLTDQGICAVSDQDVAIVSRQIEDQINDLLGEDLEGVRSTSWGVSYEQDRKYYLFTQTNADETYAKQAFVYNVFTQSWVIHTLSKQCGIVEKNILYFGDAESNLINKERKTASFSDYVDYSYSTTITSIDATGLILTLDLVDDIEAGDVIYQSNTVYAIVVSSDSVANTVTVDRDPTFTAAACEVLKAISTRVTWLPIVSGNPGITKKFHEIHVEFKSDFNGTAYLSFTSDLSPTTSSVPLQGSGNGAWGLFEWGEEVWGGEKRKRSIRQWIPRSKMVCSQLTVTFEHSVGYSPFQMQGIELFDVQGSQVNSKGN